MAVVYRYRWAIAPVFDSIAWVLAIFAASFLRFRLDSARASDRWSVGSNSGRGGDATGVGLLVLYWRRWRLGSFEEIVALTATLGGVTTVLLILSIATLRHDLPVGVVLAGSAFALVLTAGSRVHGASSVSTGSTRR